MEDGGTSEPGSAVGWADGQRALRARVAGAGFAPPSEPVAYRLVAGDRGPGPGGLVPRLVLLAVAAAVLLVDEAGMLRYALLALGFALIVRWFRGGRSSASMALYAPGAAPEGTPRLVMAIGAADAALLAPSGTGRAFGELAPGGVLGVVVGAATVWPIGPPRAGTRRDIA